MENGCIGQYMLHRTHLHPGNLPRMGVAGWGMECMLLHFALKKSGSQVERDCSFHAGHKQER